jgi:threonine/homoserine/homoserine lactone efflux protein
MVSVAQRSWTAACYWIGIAMTLACLVLIVAGNTELFWRFEHTPLPLSWVFAGVAVLAFVAFEFCESAPSPPREAEDRSSQLSREWEPVEL